MNKIAEFGRKAMFYVRVLSGYEERRLRSMRIAIQQRMQEAEAKKAALRLLPEQVILTEMRRLVTEMQNLNKKLDDTEVNIGKYFDSVDKSAEMIMDMQLKKDEDRTKQMLEIMKTQSFEENTEIELKLDDFNAEVIKDKASS